MNRKIAIVSSTAKIGGTEVSALRICNLLHQRGEEVLYIAPGAALRDEMPDIRFIPYRISRKNPAVLLRGILQLAGIIKKEGVGIAHCQDAFSCLLLCWAKKLFHLPVRLIWHERGIGFKSYTAMAKRSKMIDVIICNSYYERTLLIMNRCEISKMKVVYNAIEKQVPTRAREAVRSELNIQPEDFVLGCIGRLSWEKGVEFLLRAAAGSVEAIPGLKVLIVGDGEERGGLERLAEACGIQDRVIFTGFRRDIPDLLSAMDVYAIPSLYESFGNVTVEAMYSRVPVLASRAGGIPEVIQDGINGFLLPSAEPDQWRDRLIEVYQHRDQMAPMLERAYRDACDRYNFDRYYDLITGIYFE